MMERKIALCGAIAAILVAGFLFWRSSAKPSVGAVCALVGDTIVDPSDQKLVGLDASVDRTTMVVLRADGNPAGLVLVRSGAVQGLVAPGRLRDCH